MINKRSLIICTFALVATLSSHVYGETWKRCAKKYLDASHMLCVCNGTYCDQFPPLTTLYPSSAVIFVSSKAGKRFERTLLRWKNAKTPKPNGRKYLKRGVWARVNAGVRYQSIVGFGGAFTDSTGINLASLPNQTADNLLRSYFATDGLEYSVGRVPIASCDFSTREYSYDDVDGDFSLSHFSLTSEDRKYKIPYIKRALHLTNGNLNLFGSPWSAPAWMKTNGRMKGGGRLKGLASGPYHVTWANYYVKFLEAYAAENVTFWGLTVQNEPSTGAVSNYAWQTMYFSAQTERDFVRDILGPTLRNCSLSRNIKLMIMDDNRYLLPQWVDTVLADAAARQYVDGIGVHWYEDFFPAHVLTTVHKRHADKFILGTEACNGFFGFQGPILGDWERANLYALDIISDLNNFVSGWTDWNMALDLRGGPNWARNYVDSPIIVNASAGEFYKQPMFYAMGHFSKFIRPGSVRIQLTFDRKSWHLDGVAVATADNKRVLVIRNIHLTDSVILHIQDGGRRGQVLKVELDPQSISTVVWRKF